MIIHASLPWSICYQENECKPAFMIQPQQGYVGAKDRTHCRSKVRATKHSP